MAAVFQVQVNVTMTLPGIGPITFEQFVPVRVPEAAVPAAPAPADLPACVRTLLGQIAACDGEIRIRLETWRKFKAALPHLAAMLTPIDGLKVVNKARAYRVSDATKEAARKAAAGGSVYGNVSNSDR